MRADSDRIEDILEAIEAIERHTQGGKEAFDSDELIRVWCLKHLEIIGEAAARISEDLRSQHPSIPWKSIIGMRNILVHGYFDVDWSQVWNVVEKDLSPLKAQILRLMPDME